MRQADLAVRCEVKDKEKYYETLRNGSRQLLDAFRQSLTNIAKATVKNAKTKRSVIAKPVKVDFYDKKGEKLYFKGNRTKNLK